MRRLGWTLVAVTVFGLGIAWQRGGWFHSTPPAPPAPVVQSVQYQPSAAERIARKTDLRYLQCQPRHWRYCVIPR